MVTSSSSSSSSSSNLNLAVSELRLICFPCRAALENLSDRVTEHVFGG